MKMNFDEIKRYWEDRASDDSSAQSTTQDFYMREIEFNAISERIGKYLPNSVADIGCGDGRTTIRLASKYPSIPIRGFDYSVAMLENAQKVLSSSPATNIGFEQLDICHELKAYFDFIYTTRCLINIPLWDLQKAAIRNIHAALNVGGVYIMVENFIEGHMNFNLIRRKFDLPEIPVREHNFFLQRERLLEYVRDSFVVEEEVNISSAYYLVSRVIYSKICSETGVRPDYFDDHHRFASGLPFCGEFGPVRLLCLKKR